MKKLCIPIVFLLTFAGSAHADEPFWLEYNDATHLTIRHQETIRLDSTLYQQISAALDAARTVADTLESIHAFPAYLPDELIVKTNASWAEPWREGELRVSNQYIDSLCQTYALDSVNYSSGTFLLEFAQPLKLEQLDPLFEQSPDIIYAVPNGLVGDGDNIELLPRPNGWNFAFSRGLGDCPAGCIYRYYWYVSVHGDGEGTDPTLEEERERDFSQPILYRWNIPPRYAMTMFPDADSVLSTITGADQWWVRRHAIEGTARFFKSEDPWVGEDSDNLGIWEALRSALLDRRNEVLDTLNAALVDADSLVRSSAEQAITTIQENPISSRDGEPSLPEKTGLGKNYPNPFNGETRIPFTLNQDAAVSIIIYGVDGRQVATLAERRFSAGPHQLKWHPTGISSGIYYYQFRVNGILAETGKAVYLK